MHDTFECPKCSSLYSVECNPVRIAEFAETEIKCTNCHAEFVVTVYVDSWSFETELKEEE